MSFSTPTKQPDRDRYGRPRIVPPQGGKPVSYTRATTLAGTLEDTYNLSRWQQRMVALGLADRSDLALAVTAHRNDKQRLNDLCESAIEAAKGSAAATTGTALHALTELVDRNEELPTVPPGAEADLAAYRETTAPLAVHAIEQFVVIDDLKVAGTFDRLVELNGRRYIADIKTGTIDWGLQKIAAQLALYSRGETYNPDTYHRGSRGDVDQSNGIVIHLPAGSGTCTLHWVNIAAGWDAVQLAIAVREWRKTRDLTAPLQMS